jgi:predicted Zn-dependent peptidase
MARPAHRERGSPSERVMKAPLLVVLIATVAAAVATSVPGHAQRSAAFPTVNVHELVLENGFRVLVVEDHRVPRVASSLWYRFGARAESAGEHGSAHFLEHAIHQGTTTVGTRDFEAEKPILRRIEETEQELLAARNRDRNGVRQREVNYQEFEWRTTPELDGLRRRLYELEDEDAQYRDFWAEHNWYRRYGYFGRHTDPVPATTGYEQLEIDVDLPRENVELFFRLEADRMANAVLRGWEAQRFTVFEQVRNTYTRPDGAFYFAVDGVRGYGHPYDFQFFNRAAMLNLYDHYFVPNNATAVLVGDITIDQVRPLAERYFGHVLKAPDAPDRMDVEAEPVPHGARRLDWMEPVDPRIVVRYGIPGVGHPDRPVIETIVALLRGQTGLLGARLGNLASSITVDVRLMNMYRLGSTGAINVIVRSRRDEDLPAIESQVLSVVDALRHGRIDPAVLERARRAMRLEWEQTRAVRGSLAYELGRFEVMDSWKTLQPFMEAREHASVADVQRVAGKYLVASNQLIATARLKPVADAGGGRSEALPRTGQ